MFNFRFFYKTHETKPQITLACSTELNFHVRSKILHIHFLLNFSHFSLSKGITDTTESLIFQQSHLKTLAQCEINYWHK